MKKQYKIITEGEIINLNLITNKKRLFNKTLKFIAKYGIGQKTKIEIN